MESRASDRDLGLLDADRLPAETGTEADRRAGVVSALSVLGRGWETRLVGARSGV